jgi:hypothetical protein
MAGYAIREKNKGPTALNLLKLDHPARWAGLGKSLGLRPEIPENHNFETNASGWEKTVPR